MILEQIKQKKITLSCYQYNFNVTILIQQFKYNVTNHMHTICVKFVLYLFFWE